MSDGPSQGIDITEEDIKTERKNFLESLVRNDDGSLSVSREGRYLNYDFLVVDNIPPGIPHSDANYVAGIANLMGYKPGDRVRYKITVYLPEKESSK